MLRVDVVLVEKFDPDYRDPFCAAALGFRFSGARIDQMLTKRDLVLQTLL